MTSVIVKTKDGRRAKITAPAGATEDQIKDLIIGNPDLLGSPKMEDVYHAEKKAVIRAPAGMGADEIDYRDNTNNMGVNKSEYFGYKRVEPQSWFDATMETLAKPMDMVSVGATRGAIQAAKGASGLLRIASDVGIVDEELADQALATRSRQYDAWESVLSQKLEKYKDGGASDIVVDGVSGLGQVPFYIGAASKKGIVFLWSALSAGSAEDIYQETRASGKDDETATTTAYSLAPVVSAVDVAFERMFLKSVAPGVRQGAVKRVTRAAGADFLSEAAPQLIEDGVLSATDVRDLSVGEVIYNSLYAGLTGVVTGTVVAGGVSVNEAVKARKQQKAIDEQYAVAEEAAIASKEVGEELNEKIRQSLERVGIADPKRVADMISEAANDSAKEMKKSIQDDINLVKEDPSQAEDFIQTIQAIERGDRAKVTEMFEKAGLNDVQISEAIKNIRTPEELSDATPETKEKQIAGRIKALDNEMAVLDKDVDLALAEIEARRKEGKSVQRLESRVDGLLVKRDELDSELAELIAAEASSDIDAAAAKTNNKDIVVKGGSLKAADIKASKREVSAFKQGMIEGRMTAKEDTRLAQKQIKEVIKNQPDLTSDDKKTLSSMVTGVMTTAQVETAAKRIESRAAAMRERAARKSAVDNIKSMLSRAKKENLVDVSILERVESLVSEIDLKDRKPSTVKKIQKMVDYFGDKTDIPKSVMKKIELLNKTRLSDISTEDLVSLSERITSLVAGGELKFRIKKRRRDQYIKETSEKLAKSSKKIESVIPVPDGISEGNNWFEVASSKWRSKVRSVRLASSPVDIMFDIMDNFAKFKGENYKTFKAAVDRSFGRYLNKKEAATRKVKDISDRYKLKTSNYRAVGAYGALQQEGGREKLLAMGYTKKQLDDLSLTKEEMELYNAMREAFDAALPGVQNVMAEVYNRKVKKVDDYFPFMSDPSATKDMEIQDILDFTPENVIKSDTEQGFTKLRVGGRQSIDIDAMRVFLRHMDNAIYLTEMGKTIKDLSDIARTKTYQEAVGDIGSEMVTSWLDLLARKGRQKDSVLFLDTLRRNTGLAILGFRLSTVLIQPTALADGASKIGGDYVARGMHAIAQRRWREFTYKHMPEVRERVGDDPSYIDYGGSKLMKNAQQAGYYGLQAVDIKVAASVAAGAYMRYMDRQGLEIDLDNPNPDALEYAQLTMRRTNSSGFFKDTPLILSSGKLTGSASVDKALLQFQSFMLNRWGLIKHDMYEYGIKRGDTAEAFNTAVWLTIAATAEVALRHTGNNILNSIFGGEQEPLEETFVENLQNAFISMAPVLSQVQGSLTYSSAPVPLISSVQQVFDRVDWAKATKDEEKAAARWAQAVLLSAGITFGVPGTSQLDQVVGKMIKNAKTNQEKKNDNSLGF